MSKKITELDLVTTPATDDTFAGVQGGANYEFLTSQILRTPVDVYNVMHYGATGDGATDDTIAIQAAIDAAELVGGTVLLPGGLTYVVSGDPALTIDSKITLFAHGTTLDYKAGTGTCVLIGHEASISVLALAAFYLPRIKRDYDGGGDPNTVCLGIGLKVSNVKLSSFYGIDIRGFAKGLYLVGDDAGHGYNDFHIRVITDNLVGLEIDTIDVGADGWCNENTYYNGKIGIGAGFSSYVNTRLIAIRKAENNHHRFYNISLESTNVERKIYCVGSDSCWIFCRFEGSNGAIDIEFTAAASDGLLFYGYNLETQGITDASALTQVYSRTHHIIGGTRNATPGGILNLYNSFGATQPVLVINNASGPGNETFFIDGTGKLQWTSIAGGAVDTNLYRSAANVLKTDDKLVVALETEMDGDLNHDGDNVGLYGTAPTGQAANIANPAGGGVVDAESRAAIDLILTALEGIGITAT